jgi:hypothetical protein
MVMVMMSFHTYPPSNHSVDEAQDLVVAQGLIDAQQWNEAKHVVHRLARNDPASRKYRALFALVLGYEAESGGDHRRARAEFRRAVVLDPQLQSRPEIRRRARTSLMDRLFGR